MFGLTSIKPFAIVFPDKSAADTYFPANSPAYVVVIVGCGILLFI
jgi:hypothetical protein